MKRDEELLREACEALAREETEDLERGLNRAEIRRAEEAYRRHRPKVLSLIRRNTKGAAPSVRTYLRVAAAVAAVLGLVLVSLNRTTPDTVHLAPVPTVSLAPYYSPVPTDIPATSSPVPTVSPSVSPTFEQENTEKPDNSPTLTPSPTPTATPAAENEPAVPAEWTGRYFPFGWQADARDVSFARGEGWRSVAWTADGAAYTFTEYDEAAAVPLADSARIAYVQWEDIVALRAEEDAAVTLSWVQDGRSFSLRSTAGDALVMARTVKKIADE